MIYRYIRVFNVVHNYANSNFVFGITTLLSFVTVILIYLALTSYHLLNLLSYMLLPGVAIFSLIILTVQYPIICSWEMKSYELFELLNSRICSTEMSYMGRKALLRQKKAMFPICQQVGHMGPLCVRVSLECTEQIFNGVLLLLSL